MMIKELILNGSTLRLRKDLESGLYSLRMNDIEVPYCSGSSAIKKAAEYIEAFSMKYPMYGKVLQKEYEEFIL